jgi:uncharacterized membrane protein
MTLYEITESTLLNWIEWIITSIELLAIIVIVTAIAAATILFLYRRFSRQKREGQYYEYRRSLSHAILLGLEILIAADVIRTVTLDRTFESIIVLGLLVVVRIILSWSLMVEIENRWPWQSKGKDDAQHKGE